MSCMNPDTASFWQDMTNKLEAERPSVGKRVRIIGGRKHKGKEGTVVIHMIDRFEQAYRYATEAQGHMRDMRGRYGWTCQIQTDTERFWVKADYTEILP